MTFFDTLSALFQALMAQDAFSISDALGNNWAYLIIAIAMVPGILLLLGLFRLLPWIDQNAEKYVMVISYLTIGTIIFVEVIRRFALKVQEPWSTTLPPYLFLVMTWVGCAYNVKFRSHLTFDEFRSAMPQAGQLACLFLDAVLWLGFGLIVIVTTLRQTLNAAANFQIMLGTDNVMQWWFYISVPIAWLILCARVVENLAEDLHDFRGGKNLMARERSMIQE